MVQVRHDTVLVPTTIYQLQKVPADTAMIIAEWNKVREYSDTLVDNSDVYIHLSEKVAYNALFDRKTIYEVRCQDKIINNYPNRFYWGAAGSYTDRFDVYLSFAYQRERYLYFGGLNNRAFLFSVMRSF